MIELSINDLRKLLRCAEHLAALEELKRNDFALGHCMTLKVDGAEIRFSREAALAQINAQHAEASAILAAAGVKLISRDVKRGDAEANLIA